MGAGNEYPDFDRVGTDSYAATQMALDHLFELGHRRIGLILGERHSPTRDSRLAGYNDFYHRQQLPLVWEDEESPYLHGQIGLSNFGACHTQFDSVTLNPLGKISNT